MPTSVFESADPDSSKRTRSQLTIPDVAFHHIALSRSPLKNARAALRSRQPVRTPQQERASELKPQSKSAMDASADESEDEILLSPRKKRPSSEAPVDPSGSSDSERDTKRPRYDPFISNDDSENSQNILFSETHKGKVVRTRPFQRAATASASRKPLSHSSATTSGPATPSRQRAQSVPLQTSNGGDQYKIPHLDLSTPMRARSPLKSPLKFRVTSAPPLDPVHDIEERDEGKEESSASPMVVDANSTSRRPSTPPSPTPTSPSAPAHIEVNMAPRTPRNFRSLLPLGSPMSPLTPLLPTPYPPKAREDTATSSNPFKSVTTSLRNVNGAPAMGDATAPLDAQPSDTRPNTSAPTPAPSRLPRPSSSLLMPPPSMIPAHAAKKGKEKAVKAPVKVPVGGRVTRSAALRMKQNAAAAAAGAPASHAGPSTGAAPSLDHRKSSSFSFSFAAPTSSSANKTREKNPSSPSKSSPSKKAVGSFSPAKPTTSKRTTIGRSATASSFSSTSTTSTSSHTQSKPASSLRTLSNALEKLSLPRPERPGTSLGFRESERVEFVEEEGKRRGKDDGALGRASGIGLGRPSVGLKRAATIGSMQTSTSAKPVSSSTIVPAPPTSVAGPSSEVAPSQPKRTLFPFATPAGKNIDGSIKPKINLSSGIVVSRNRFGMGAAGRGKVSRKTSLPSVAASPVKGGGRDIMEEREEEAESSKSGALAKEHSVVSSDKSTEDIVDIESDDDEKGRAKEDPVDVPKRTDDWRRNASRRASLASQALSQSLNGVPEPQPSGAATTGLGVRSSSSSYPASSTGMRSAPGALGGKVKGGTGGHVSASEGRAKGNGDVGDGTIGKVLKECTIFVDVRTDGGDDAGGLFVDMLRGMGAKILGRVGQTCTHIVYKNGLMSTLTRYRLLHEPRPLVVGIAWVVECVEQRARVDEAKFQIDLEGVNVAGVNKRRRSMLPKHIADVNSPASTSSLDVGDVSMRTVGDQSIDGSSSSVLDGDDITSAKTEKNEWDDLPPLERARRRRMQAGR